MNRVFEFDSETDIIYDPGKIIEIQELVRELIKGNAHRQDELKEQILAKGAWAITGLINSTMVYMREMKDSPTQDLLASLMCSLAADNSTARDVIFRSGAIEAPFAEPRSIAIRALEKLDWRPSEEQQHQILRKLNEMKYIGDDHGEFDMYRLLVRSRKETVLNALVNTCKSWIGERKSPGALLALLVENHPQKAVRIISDVFLAVDDEVTAGHKDKFLAKELTTHLKSAAVQQKWLENDVLIDVTREVLEEMIPPRHTTVEYLWVEIVGTLRLYPNAEQQRILQHFGEMVRMGGQSFSNEEAAGSLYRYWFKAVGSIGAMDYLNDCAQSQDDLWAIYAILQFMFAHRLGHSASAEQMLSKLERKHYDRISSADSIFQAITNRKSTPSVLKIWEPKPRKNLGTLKLSESS